MRIPLFYTKMTLRKQLPKQIRNFIHYLYFSSSVCFSHAFFLMLMAAFVRNVTSSM